MNIIIKVTFKEEYIFLFTEVIGKKKGKTRQDMTMSVNKPPNPKRLIKRQLNLLRDNDKRQYKKRLNFQKRHGLLQTICQRQKLLLFQTTIF